MDSSEDRLFKQQEADDAMEALTQLFLHSRVINDIFAAASVRQQRSSYCLNRQCDDVFGHDPERLQMFRQTPLQARFNCFQPVDW